MTKRKNYPRLRNGKLEGTGMPPHFIDEKKKEVVFYIKGGLLIQSRWQLLLLYNLCQKVLRELLIAVKKPSTS